MAHRFAVAGPPVRRGVIVHFYTNMQTRTELSTNNTQAFLSITLSHKYNISSTRVKDWTACGGPRHHPGGMEPEYVHLSTLV